MTIENLKENIKKEKEILREIFYLYSQFHNVSKIKEGFENKNDLVVLSNSISSLKKQMLMLNKSVPHLIWGISSVKQLPQVTEKKEKKLKDVVRVKYRSGGKEVFITLNKKDKEKFLKELKISEDSISRIKIKKKKKEELFTKAIKKTSIYAKISNKFFFGLSNSLIKKGYFNDLKKNIQQATMPHLLSSYVSMAFLSSLLSLIFGIAFIYFSLFFEEFLILGNILFNIFVGISFPIFVFLGFLLYPVSESKNAGAKIDQELPFVVLHMGAIAGSKIEPNQIFRIIASSNEYPYTKKEIIKIMNQTNIYGYDLVSSLRNVSKHTPSKKFSDLLNGLSATISGGGDLIEFFNKRSETLFFGYKIDKERFTKEAETFMDLYISLVIAAPMMLGILLVLLSMGNMNIGIGTRVLMFLMIGGIVLLNIFFLAFLNVKQPSY